MATMHLLYQAGMEWPVAPIEIVADWGPIEVVVGDKGVVRGTHIAVSGKPTDLVRWLSGCGEFWKGIGTPMAQRFRVATAKELELIL